MAATVVQLRPYVIEPPGRAGGGGVTGVVIEDPPESPASQEPNGDIVISIGDDQPRPVNDRFDANLAERMDPMALAALASRLLDGIDADLQSRADWEETANRAASFLGIKLEDPTSSVSADGTVSKAISTAMLEALIRSWGVARAELLPVNGPVKVRRDKPPTPLTPQATGIAAQTSAPAADAAESTASALETDLNHYLTKTDKEYYPDFSKMLLSRALVGMAFRKVYRCPIRRRPVSVWVKAQDLIVSNDTVHLSRAGRATERIKISQGLMRRLQVIGHYLDKPIAHPTGMATETEIAIGQTEGVDPQPQLPEDYEHTVYECYTELGSGTSSSLIGDLSLLDRDETGRRPGYPLPYRVSIDLDSREILEIRRNWEPGDEDHRAQQWYVKYGFIPGLGFYDLGLIHIAGNPTLAATMIQRACTDASLFANFPAFIGLKGPATRQTNTVIRPGPGEVVAIDGNGASKVADALMPLPYRPPGGEEIALSQKYEADVRRLAGVIELPVGEGRIGNTPVGTILAYIEAVTQVPGAVHKDDHIAQQEEFELLRKLFARDPSALIAGNRSPARQWQAAQEILDPELVPAADPNTSSMVHRLMKMQGLVTVGGLPQFQGVADNRAIYSQVVRVITGEDPADYTLPPPQPQQAPPDPRIVAAQIKAQSDTTKAQAQVATQAQQHQERMAEIAQEGEQREADRESAEVRAAMSVDAARIKAAADLARSRGDSVHDAIQRHADRTLDHTQHMDQMVQNSAQQFSAPLSAPEGGNG